MGRIATFTAGIILGLMPLSVQASDPPKDPIAEAHFNNPYTDAEMAEALAPYNFRYLTQADLAALPEFYTETKVDDDGREWAEVSGWAQVYDSKIVVLYKTQGGAESGETCLPISKGVWLWNGFFKADQGGDERSKDPNFWHGKYVRLIGYPQYSPKASKDEFGGGWVMYPPLSVPDQADCDTDIGFLPLDIFLGR